MITVSTWTGVEVKALRTAALRMTQEEFAEATGYQPPTVRKWERATAARPVRGKSALDLDTTLAGLDAQQRQRFCAAVADARHRMVAHAGSSDMTNDVVGSAVEAHQDEREEDELKRREFGFLLGATLVASGVNSNVVPNRIGVADARRLADSVIELSQREQVLGGGTLVQEAVATLEVAMATLESCAFDEVAGRGFMTATGELATIAGWVAYDADLNSLARRCYADAFALANQAGDNGLTVHVCLNAAHQTINLSRTGSGSPYRALGLIGRAKDLMRGHPPGRIHALIAIREAQAYAVLGDRQPFGRAIATAWRELDSALSHESIDECPEWLRFVSPNEIRCHEARGVGDLGDLEKSAVLSSSLVLEQAGARNAAAYRAGWAAALAKAGDIGAAVTQASAVLSELEKQVSSTRTLKLLEPVRTASGVHDDSFNQRFDDLVRRATAV
ncbi:helix-turn-helix domain-containing protein [Nocardia sp. NPDC051787]|uniref:helix-turn-helix domain-containing protein n=1 Tax=Nocardia sp. NPDC051787 TaxID=3155415 RepID=UPI0034135592